MCMWMRPLASDGHQGVAVGGGGQGFLPVSCWDTRARSELETMLGTEFDVLSSDDFSVYNGYRVQAQQMFGASDDILKK